MVPEEINRAFNDPAAPRRGRGPQATAKTHNNSQPMPNRTQYPRCRYCTPAENRRLARIDEMRYQRRGNTCCCSRQKDCHAEQCRCGERAVRPASGGSSLRTVVPVPRRSEMLPNRNGRYAKVSFRRRRNAAHDRRAEAVGQVPHGDRIPLPTAARGSFKVERCDLLLPAGGGEGTLT